MEIKALGVNACVCVSYEQEIGRVVQVPRQSVVSR